MAGVAAVHHAARDHDSVPRDVVAAVDVRDPEDLAGMDSQPELKIRPASEQL